MTNRSFGESVYLVSEWDSRTSTYSQTRKFTGCITGNVFDENVIITGGQIK